MSSQHQTQETQETVRRQIAGEQSETATIQQHPAAIMQRMTSGASVSAGDVLQLQQQLGNKTVSRLLSDRAKQGNVQRKFAGGQVQREAEEHEDEGQEGGASSHAGETHEEDESESEHG